MAFISPSQIHLADKIDMKIHSDGYLHQIRLSDTIHMKIHFDKHSNILLMMAFISPSQTTYAKISSDTA